MQGRGKSFLNNPGKLSIKMPDGSFKELGRTVERLELKDNGEESNWSNGIHSSFSVTCEIKDTPESRKAMRELRDWCEKSAIEDVLRTIRILHHRHRILFIHNKRYRYINTIVHKHYNMNFTRYCRSIGIKYFTGFWVLLDSGCWVKKK